MEPSKEDDDAFVKSLKKSIENLENVNPVDDSKLLTQNIITIAQVVNDRDKTGETSEVFE